MAARERDFVNQVVTKQRQGLPLTVRERALLNRWQAERKRAFYYDSALIGSAMPPVTHAKPGDDRCAYEEETWVPEGWGVAFWGTWTVIVAGLAGIFFLVKAQLGTAWGLLALTATIALFIGVVALARRASRA